MFYFIPCFLNHYTHSKAHVHTLPILQISSQSRMINWSQSISLLALEQPSSSRGRSLVSIKVQQVIWALKDRSKWQESLGGQFVFSWGAVFVAFSSPQGNKGNQLQLVEGDESEWPLTPAVEVTSGLQKRATAAEYSLRTFGLLLKLCMPIGCTCTLQTQNALEIPQTKSATYSFQWNPLMFCCLHMKIL